MAPPTMSTTPNSPRVWANVRTVALVMPEELEGRASFSSAAAVETGNTTSSVSTARPVRDRTAYNWPPAAEAQGRILLR